MSEPARTDGSAPSGELQANALGVVGTVSLTAAFMAPAASLIALFGPIVRTVGQATGFVMLLGLLVTLPSAISFGMLARELPSAGGVYAWARHTLGEHIGRWVGLTTAMYYLLTIFFPPIVFGQLFNTLLVQFGFHVSTYTWLVGAVLSLVIAGFSTYRGIAVSSALAFAMLVIQLVIMTALAATFLVIAVNKGTFTWAPFRPSGATGGWTGILLALPPVLLSLTCDAATPASEETRNARRTIPVAVIATLVLVGGWNVLAYGALAMAAPPAELLGLCRTNLDNAIPPLAALAWGHAQLLITLVGMSAMIGALVACSTAASRLLYSLGRDGVLPGRLGSVHPHHHTPWKALHVVFAVTLLAIVPAAFVAGPTRTFDWWLDAVAWFIIAVYFAANLCNLLFNARFRRESFSILWNLLAPCLAMLCQIWFVQRVLVGELWQAGWPGRSVQAFILLTTLGTAGYAWHTRGAHRRVLSPDGAEDRTAHRAPTIPEKLDT